MSYGSDLSKVISTSGVLTSDMIEQASQKAFNSSGKVNTFVVFPKFIQSMIEWEKREKQWKALGPLGEKKERLRWRLKHRIKHTVMNLPE